MNVDNDAEVVNPLPGDTRIAAQRAKDRRHEQEVLERDRKSAWAAVQESMSGGSQGTSKPRDPLYDIPRRS